MNHTIDTPTADAASTKSRILDAAERLFADFGFEATSLRSITTEANVNLAAVNYHFQSKEALLDAVVHRRVTPVNARRLQLLEQFEAAANPHPVPVEQILQAFLRPLLESSAIIPKLMVRFMYLESTVNFKRLFETHLQSIVQRFSAALMRSLPHVAPHEVFLRMMFVIGAFGQLMSASQRLPVISQGRIPAPAPQEAMKHLILFAAAGLRAPALEESHHGTN